MKKLLLLILLVILGVFAWRIGERLSPDALGMGIGVLLGVMAGVPAALLLLASNRRRGEQDDAPGYAGGGRAAQGYPYPPQAPVIVLTGAGMAAPPQQGGPGYPDPRRALPAPRTMDAQTMDGERRFKVVGEQEEWIDEW
jgi:hypothetical protein